MKNVILILFALGMGLGTMAQNPCDAQLLDRTKEHIGQNAEMIENIFFDSPCEGQENAFCAVGIIADLVKNELFRFTTGNSELSAGDVSTEVVLTTIKNNKVVDTKEIKKQITAPGEFTNFEFLCDSTTIYSISITQVVAGNTCAAVIVSRVR